MSDSLVALEPRLRSLLPADLYAAAWVDPSPAMLRQVFEHLRTLLRVLQDYMPRHLLEAPPRPGYIRHAWHEDTLMFTDLAGFTALVEANAVAGTAGAQVLLKVLNDYFATMIEIVGKGSGNLLEFTGDAMLIQFPADQRGGDVARAIRAGLRMQRAMARFGTVSQLVGTPALGMRIGIHQGRFLVTDVGTPRRMEHVLLGNAVQLTKSAESMGLVGRVCVTEAAQRSVQALFRWEAGQPGYALVIDDLDAEALGEYDLLIGKRRPPSPLLLDQSSAGLMETITEVVARAEPLASYIPPPILHLLVENAANRAVPPDFPQPTVMFVNLIGLPESVDQAQPAEENAIVQSFSQAFALINAAVEARGGILKKVTYHIRGSDMTIYFGVPNAHTDDNRRAASAALAIRDVVGRLVTPVVAGRRVEVSYRIGIACGTAFAAEIGEPRGRREFNVLGDTVNTAARLMNHAEVGQILLAGGAFEAVQSQFHCEPLGRAILKGKSQLVPVYELLSMR